MSVAGFQWRRWRRRWINQTSSACRQLLLTCEEQVPLQQIVTVPHCWMNKCTDIILNFGLRTECNSHSCVCEADEQILLAILWNIMQPPVVMNYKLWILLSAVCWLNIQASPQTLSFNQEKPDFLIQFLFLCFLFLKDIKFADCVLSVTLWLSYSATLRPNNTAQSNKGSLNYSIITFTLGVTSVFKNWFYFY